MSFITNIFLWLLPLISIPLIIHLLNRKKIIKINFSSIQFLKELESESIKKINILQWLLLIIRTLIILLIILMMSRPILKGYFPSLRTDPSSSLSVIMIDDSFSMHGIYNDFSRHDLIYNTYRKILNTLPAQSQVCIISLNNGILYEGMKENAPNNNSFINITNDNGKIYEYIKIIKEKFNKGIINKEVFIITDGQESLFDSLDEENSADWKLYFALIDKLEVNLQINTVNILNDIIIKDKVLDIEVEVYNSGLEKNDNASMFLEVNDIKVANAGGINIKPNEKQFVYFRSTLPNYKDNSIKVCLQNDDDNLNDNCHYMNIYIPDTINILSISDNPADLKYISNAIHSINNNNDNDIFSYKLSGSSDWNINQLKKQNIVIVSDYKIIDYDYSLFEEYLQSKDSHLIIMPSNDNTVNSVYGVTGINDTTSNQFIELNSNIYEKILLKNILNLDNTKVDKSKFIKVFKYIKQSINSNTRVPLNDKDTFWDTFFIGESQIDIFYSLLNFEWNTLPLKGIFVQFIHELLYSNYNQENYNKYIDDQVYLNIDNISDKQIDHKNPHGELAYIIKDDNNFIVNDLEEIGLHDFYNNDILLYTIAVNPAMDELKSNLLQEEEIEVFFKGSLYFLQLDSDISSVIKDNREGYEIWRYLLWIICCLLICEMLISNPKKEIQI